MRLKDKVAIVTGAGRGIGRGIALKLAAEGAKVVVVDVVEENAQKVVEQIKQAGGMAIASKTDISKVAEVEAMFAKGIGEFGPIDILVNNAGINRDVMLHKMTDEQWQQVIGVNLTGTFYCLREAARQMRERGYGRIINVASMSWRGNFGQANYSAAKGGVVGFDRDGGARAGEEGRNRQCHQSRLRGYGDDARGSGEDLERHDRQDLDGKSWRTGGRGQCGGFPGLR